MSGSTSFRKSVALIGIGLMGIVGIPAFAAEPQNQPAMVELNFPDNLELKTLVDYVGKRLNINFLYDENLAGKRITLKTPKQIPVDSLMGLMESALRMKGLAVYPQADGTLRIEMAKQLTQGSTSPTTLPAGSEARPGIAVTRFFELKNTSPQRLDEIIKPFLSTPSASTTQLVEHKTLIVTDYAENMKRLQELVDLMDRPTRNVQARPVPLKHIDASSASQKVNQLLSSKAKSRNATPETTAIADEQGNQVLLIGPADEIADAVDMISTLDVGPELKTKTYSFSVATAERVDKLMRDLLGEQSAKRIYKSAIEHDSNIMIVTSTPEVLEQIDAMGKLMDKPVADAQSPIRFYRLENAKATELVSTLQYIEGNRTSTANNANTDANDSRNPQKSDNTPDKADIKTPASADRFAKGPSPSQINDNSRLFGSTAKPTSLQEISSTGETRIVADEPSNTIIIVAKPAIQAVYEKLIKQLDVRRPQVLVEATIVALDTTDDFSLGVELSTTAGAGSVKNINFSSFGLSTPNPDTGKLALRPGTGFNGVLLSSDVAEVVIRALQSDSRAKVMSRPSVLINDNATGELASESEQPYASVNASTTVATTSFAGYSSAGTKIIIKPQISEGEYLKLKYDVTLSSFGSDKTTNLPPSRQTNALSSEVTIPDGHTIIVGGLTRETFSESIDRVPILGEIPGLEYLFSKRGNSTHKSTLFVFLRAVILRNDKFEDLKTLSRIAGARSGIPDDLPTSEPIAIE